MNDVRPRLRSSLAVLSCALAGCAAFPSLNPPPYHDHADSEFDAAVKSEIGDAGTPRPAAAVSRAPDAGAAGAGATPAAPPPRPAEPHFDVSVNNAPVRDLLMSIVNGTRYSMVVHPDLVGNVSLELKDTTVPEVLEVLRDVYGYDFQIRGMRVMVESGGLETRVFNIDYLSLTRTGKSDLRVTSGSLSTPGNTPYNGATNVAAGITQVNPLGGTVGGTQAAVVAQESSHVTTTQQNDVWQDLNTTLKMIVGTGEGRQVVVSPPTGTVVVRAMPRELVDVSRFLRTLGVNIGRQVMLEAKIVDVELSDSQQQGINWAAFHAGGARVSGGQVTPGTNLQTNGALATGGASVDPTTGLVTNPTLSATPGASIAVNPPAVGGLLGLAFQTGNFAAMLEFLQTQGKVHVLSSPRIATINNQKAVIKVGTDDFFVTNVTTTTVATGTGSTSSPSVTVQPFFSGIALDVTAHVDENDNVTLHVHPQVSQVTEKDQIVNLGQAGTLTLPLASSAVSEADSIVRIANLNIAAIGGLMSRQDSITRSGIPGVSDLPFLGALFRQNSTSLTKRELVILIKPTVIHDGGDWEPVTASETHRFAPDPVPAAERAPAPPAGSR
jgi:MSHA biogenesis protein MshL